MDGEGNPVPAVLVAAVSVEDHGRAPQVFELENDYSWTDTTGATLDLIIDGSPREHRRTPTHIRGTDQGYLLWKGPRADMIKRVSGRHDAASVRGVDN